MDQTEIAVIGGGPAGLSAALQAARLGARVTLIDGEDRPGGQLVKQTHKFFGSRQQHAGRRGIDIAAGLVLEAMSQPGLEVWTQSTVLGYYDDRVLGVERGGRFVKLKAERIIVATGASEKVLAFPNNDLPGVYGAGAVQTLMNLHGVKPGNSVLMVGAGNIGLIVSYQLRQAGVNVKAIVEASPRIGGYLVHAAKVRRAGIRIYTSHTVKRAYGKDCVEGATIWQLDRNWEPVPGTEKDFEVDAICLAVGLTPLADLLWQAGCRMRFIPELGGHVPERDRDLETSVPGLYVAGDVAGVEEASSAMVEGQLAGLMAAAGLGHAPADLAARKEELHGQLAALRSGPTGVKIRQGLAQLGEPYNAN